MFNDIILSLKYTKFSYHYFSAYFNRKMRSFVLFCAFICCFTKSLQESTISDENDFNSLDIKQLSNVVNDEDIDSSIVGCATQCLSGCAQCESQCELACNANEDPNNNEINEHDIFGASDSVLSRTKIFGVFFGNGVDKSVSYNQTRRYWRNQQSSTETVDLSSECSSTISSACVTGCKSICSVCEYECGLNCAPEEATSSIIVKLVKNQILSKLDDSHISSVCDSTCNAMCSSCECQCMSQCVNTQQSGNSESSSCEQICGQDCMSCESECSASCSSQASIEGSFSENNDATLTESQATIDGSLNENNDVTLTESIDEGEQLSILELDQEAIDSSSLNNEIIPEPENNEIVPPSCQSACSSCIPECELSCSSGNPFGNDGSNLNKKGVISPASWYSSRFKMFELFVQQKSVKSSVKNVEHSENYARNDNCGEVKESACNTACQRTCSFCQLQCEALNSFNEEIDENNDNGITSLTEDIANNSPVSDETMGLESLQNYYDLMHSLQSQVDKMCDEVCNTMCSTCQCLCESACLVNLAQLAIHDGAMDNIGSRCATTCEDSCGTCEYDCISACSSTHQSLDVEQSLETPATSSETDEISQNSPVPPPIGTELSFDMHTRIAGEGLSVTIYFIVVEDGMKMYCDTSALPGTTADNIWSQETTLSLDNEDIEQLPENDSFDYLYNLNYEIHDNDNIGDVDSDNSLINQDVDIMSNNGDFEDEHDEDVSELLQEGRKKQVRAGSCHESMPHIYILKDTSCCGFPSLPQCNAVNGRELGCVDKLGK